jgi:hypothetical protein
MASTAQLHDAGPKSAGNTDIDNDGVTNILDLIMLLELWGPCE